MKTNEQFHADAAAAIACAQELRLALTQHCQYSCRFCHRDGTGLKSGQSHSASEWLHCIIEPALKLGIRRITLTGGEPTLRTETICELLRALGTLPENTRPSIKLITNGLFIRPELISELHAYPGERSVHFSLHATEPEMYGFITGWAATAETLESLKNRIHRFSAIRIPVTINAVILRRLNDRASTLSDLINTANSLNAKEIQFIPLEGRRGDYFFDSYYVSPETIETTLLSLSSIRKKAEQGRKILFTYNYNPHLNISITRCTCHMGCASCHRYRPIIIDSDFNYHPCKLPPATFKPIPIKSPDDFATALASGEKIVTERIRQFGNGSPITVKEGENHE